MSVPADGVVDPTTLPRDLAHVWHPYTPLDRRATTPPLHVVAADGPWLTLADGRRLLDGIGSWWVSVLGHRHPRVMDALHRQLDVLPHCIMAQTTHTPAADLAWRLCRLAPPGLSRVFYSDNGSTAVEVAIRAAFQACRQRGEPERRLFVTFDGAYHGDTLGAVSVGGLEVFHGPLRSLTFESLRVPSPAGGPGAEAACLEALAALEGPWGDQVVGLVLEPLVQGAAGMRMHSSAFLQAVRAWCDRTRAFWIADEVFTGFGRTGTLFACEQAQVSPDLLCLSKGLSGGTLPFGATLVRDRVYEAFAGGADRAFLYGHSFAGNPLGCAAALAVLDAFEHDGVLAHARTHLHPRMEAARDHLAGLPHVRNARTLGMILAAEVEVGATGYGGLTGSRLADEAVARGLLLRPLGGTAYLTPALTLSPDELDRMLDRFCDTVEACAP
jgi:adenosylmethionine-8-amino-7-oxononanoate aminotransferase